MTGNSLKLKAGQSLDRETEPTVTLTVTASDDGTPNLDRSAAFTIAVNDVNEAPTNISLGANTVNENQPGVVIGKLAVSDVDLGDAHTFVVSDNRFEVVDGFLKLKSGVSLNHEEAVSVNLSVTSTDRGTPGLAVTRPFSITVVDVNEAPTSLTLSNNSVSENAIAATIGTLAVTDPDPGNSHTFAVSDSRFEITGNSLKLKSGQSLDRESEPTITLTVTATDNGTPILSRSAAFMITVGNVNEAPTGISLSNSTIDESQAGVVIGKLTVGDVDLGDSHTFAVSDNRRNRPHAKRLATCQCQRQ